MNRRFFLLSSFSAAAATVAAPALAKTPADDKEAARIFSDAWSEARSAGLLVLVVVVPESDEDRWTRNSALGAWMNHGGDEAFALLGSSIWVCASAKQIRTFAPHAEVPKDAWMMLFDPATTPARSQPIAVTLPIAAPAGEEQGWDAMLAAEEAQVDRQIVAIQKEVEGVFSKWGRSGLTGSERTAAIARGKQSVAGEPRGAYWANSGGCGVDIEGDPNPMMVDCGMGHSSAKATRFLYFYTLNGQR